MPGVRNNWHSVYIYIFVLFCFFSQECRGTNIYSFTRQTNFYVAPSRNVRRNPNLKKRSQSVGGGSSWAIALQINAIKQHRDKKPPHTLHEHKQFENKIQLTSSEFQMDAKFDTSIFAGNAVGTLKRSDVPLVWFISPSEGSTSSSRSTTRRFPLEVMNFNKPIWTPSFLWSLIKGLTRVYATQPVNHNNNKWGRQSGFIQPYI